MQMGEISDLFLKRSRRFYFSSLFVKIALVAFASGIVGVAQFMGFPDEGQPSSWQLIGITSAFIAAIGSIFVVITESDASEELRKATGAIERANELTRTLDEFEVYEEFLRRGVELYSAMSIMRGVLESTAGSQSKDEVRTIGTLMDTAGRSLSIAMGFQQFDRWTICIYKAEFDSTSKRTELRCIAQKRALDCPIEDARRWPEGVGVGGIAFSKGGEIIVPDLLAEELGTVLNLGDRSRDYDRDRYRSIVAVPVLVGSKKWGVVIATNDRGGHFYVDENPGVKTTEAARALAGMVALAVAMCETPVSPVSPSSTNKP